MKGTNSNNLDLLKKFYSDEFENRLAKIDFNKFNYDNLRPELKDKFDVYIKKGILSKGMIETAFAEGYINGVEISFYEGIEKCRETGITNGVIASKFDMILSLYNDGVGLSSLAKASKLTEEEVQKILKERGGERLLISINAPTLLNTCILKGWGAKILKP